MSANPNFWATNSQAKRYYSPVKPFYKVTPENAEVPLTCSVPSCEGSGSSSTCGFITITCIPADYSSSSTENMFIQTQQVYTGSTQNSNNYRCSNGNSSCSLYSQPRT